MKEARLKRLHDVIPVTFRKKQTYRDRREVRGCQGLGGRVGVEVEGFDYKGTQGKLLSDETILCVACGDDHTTVHLSKLIELYTTKVDFTVHK